ncbi:MAG TPA: GtrA family protein [Acidobacteriaceae bacterium]|nr:GtrA family protein [Acidobacteriaceae bacterium]
MKLTARWWRFNLVGAIGVPLQLASLAILRLWFAAHYLLITFAAVEFTLLHNFIWHLHYTWKDRRSHSALPQLCRFHLSNGLVSIVGNLMLMRVFVRGVGLPLLPANALAIFCCSIANFCLANVWAFA